MERDLGRLLIAIGAVLVMLGFALMSGGGLRLGRLPGDLSVSRGGLRIYLPLASCALLSIVVTAVMRLLGSR